MLLVMSIRDFALDARSVHSTIKSTLIELASIIGGGTTVEPFDKKKRKKNVKKKIEIKNS